MVTFSFVIIESLKEAGLFFLEWWWFFTPLILWTIFQLAWINYVQEKYFRKIKWHLIEIKIPKEIEKRPKTMEEFFAAIYSSYAVAIDTIFDVYLDGVLDVWFSLEIVSIGGDIRYYIRTPIENLEMIESQIYAQYPDAEIKEVDDYVTDIPDDIPSPEYDLWGTDMTLKKDDAYPIRTYQDFEDTASGEFVDPMSNLIEGVSKLQKGEQIWIQILIRATGDDWKENAYDLVLSLIGRGDRKKKKPAGFFSLLVSEIIDLGRYTILGFFSPQGILESGEKVQAEKESLSMMLHLSPGEKEVVTKIEESTKKPGFETDIRWIYLAKRDIFNKTKGNSIVFSYLSQFGSQDLNALVPDSKTKTSAYYFLTDYRKALRKRKILRRYKRREFDKMSYVMNVEELATLFHFPTFQVVAPIAPRVEAKRGKPPAGLPI
ncbi:hypothetical protein K0B03_03565 [Patescibacteria group bacterium]|nr:hypothetical protein [Patescibacteria group bacterium]